MAEGEKRQSNTELQMKSKHNQIRVLGQRSIPSSFIFRSSNFAKDSKDESQKKGLNKDSGISLSDFLDQKLQTNSVLPKIVKGKSKPFKSPVGPKDDEWSTNHRIGTRKEEKETNSVIDQAIFQQFKPCNTEKIDGTSSYGGGGGVTDGEIGTSSPSLGISSSHFVEIGTSNSHIDPETTRKRRNPFEDGHGKQPIRKKSLVLGDSSDPIPKPRGKRRLSNNKARPLYNHYANGSGWWDCEMEGVDSEVGLGEVWEGVGTTTLGGIEWH